MLYKHIRTFFNRHRPWLCVTLCVLMTMLVVQMFTGHWPWKVNDYNSYTLQARSWLDGHLDLVQGENYPWLELAIYNGKYYVSFPPFPSYVMLPFAAVFGSQTPDGWIALCFLLLSCYYAARLFRQVRGNSEGLEILTLYLLLANGYLYLTINGWVWFLAQNMCFALSLMALSYAYEGKGGLSLGFWACAVGCRPMVALYLPLLVYLICRHSRLVRPQWGMGKLILKRWYWGIAPLLIALSYMALNYARFGNVIEFGHNYLPEFTRAGATPQFSFQSLLPNLKLYLRLPQWKDNQYVAFYAMDGNAFYLANPLLVTALGALVWRIGVSAAHMRRTPAVCRPSRRRWPVMVMVPLLFALHVVWICCHATLGAVQFGNRYLVDTLPYLFFGLLWWMPDDKRFICWHLPLVCYGACLHLVGTVFSYLNLL